jgi:hypothetical protein
MSKTSNNLKLAVLKIWLEDLKKKQKPKRKTYYAEEETAE